MSFGRSLTLFIITVSLVSCLTGKQLDAPAYYEAPAPADTNKLRFDGFYSNTSKPGYPRNKYSAVNPVFFTPKNRIHVSHGANIVTDSSLFTCRYYQQMNPADLGVYIIEGNKISAFVPAAVAMGEGAWYGIYNLHFSGTIVSKDSITNWKAVPPFPKRIKKRDMENSQNSGIFAEHDLKFIQADSISCLNP
ncbi:hypothetical protein [Chitinophaga sp. 22620]|uniref:hypothetical protein n=1 Tax=Chitinophaga sp. 22620 TaxID=3453952 RepID=UPI003F8699B7